MLLLVSWIHSLHVYGKKLINFHTPFISDFHIFHWVAWVPLYGLGQPHSFSQKDGALIHKSVHHIAFLQLHNETVTYNYEYLGIKIWLRGECTLRYKCCIGSLFMFHFCFVMWLISWHILDIHYPLHSCLVVWL